EVAEAADVGVEVVESTIPMHPEVKGMCEILGLDPLYLANEGKIACIVAPEAVDAALSSLTRHPLGTTASVIGRIVDDHPGRVVMETIFGAKRVVDMLVGDQLPRIC